MGITTFEHITLNTNHSHISGADRVKNETVTFLLRPLLQKALDGHARIEMPAIGRPYSFSAEAFGTTLLLTVWKSAVAVVTMGVALEPEQGRAVWRRLHEKCSWPLALMTDANCPPNRPWIAISLEIGLMQAFEASEWLGDFEECVAWAWVKMQGKTTENDESNEREEPSHIDAEDMASTASVDDDADSSQGCVALAIGQRCPLDLPEGGVIQLSSGGLTLFINIPDPDDFEKKAFKSGHPLRVGLATVGRTGFLLANFGDGFMTDLPFDAGLELPENRPQFEELTAQSRIQLLIVGVDGRTNRVFGLRLITLSPRVTAEVVKVLARQALVPVARNEHLAMVDQVYARYPNTKDLMRIALAMDKAGE